MYVWQHSKIEFVNFYLDIFLHSVNSVNMNTYVNKFKSHYSLINRSSKSDKIRSYYAVFYYVHWSLIYYLIFHMSYKDTHFCTKKNWSEIKLKVLEITVYYIPKDPFLGPSQPKNSPWSWRGVPLCLVWRMPYKYCTDHWTPSRPKPRSWQIVPLCGEENEEVSQSGGQEAS